MGLNMGNFLKQDPESLVVDKKKQAIKALIVVSIILIIALVVVIVLKGNEGEDDTRRVHATKDIQNMRNYVENEANLAKKDSFYVLPGVPLDNQPYVLNVNGVEEEYRYGYYYLSPEVCQNSKVALLLPNEHYIVNYDTYDVVNIYGVEYKGKVYHSIDDLIAIEAGNVIPSENTIIIRTAQDMQALHQNPASNFKLAANIDMKEYATGEGWTPVKNFTGMLDGRGYTINNLTIYKPTESYVGLFAEVKTGAEIVNLTLENSDVTGENYTGILAGTMAGKVNNIILSKGKVSGVDKVGAITGSLQGTIEKAKIDINLVNGENQIGGLVGILNSGVINECLVEISNINGNSAVGGVAGSVAANAESSIIECAAKYADMSGTDELGGIIGKVEILSTNRFKIENSYAIGNISTGKSNMGGLIGYARAASGAVVLLEDSYAAVTILNKNETAGGCIGYLSIPVTSTISANHVFWEKNLAVGEVLESVGTQDTKNVTNFTALSSAEMTLRSTFTDWDFDLWEIVDHKTRPYLKFEQDFVQNKQEIVKEK